MASRIAVVAAIAVVCLGAVRPAPLHAQTGAIALHLQGTADYNLIWNSAASRTGAGQSRYGGRIAAAIAPRLLLGVSDASWQFELPIQLPPAGGGYQVSAVPTAVVLAGYLQLYPVNSWLFMRASVGYASTRTYEFDGYIDHARVAAGGGVGIDIPLRPHLAFTPSLDVTRILGSTGLELRSGIVAGIGLTVR